MNQMHQGISLFTSKVLGNKIEYIFGFSCGLIFHFLLCFQASTDIARLFELTMCKISNTNFQNHTSEENCPSELLALNPNWSHHNPHQLSRPSPAIPASQTWHSVQWDDVHWHTLHLQPATPREKTSKPQWPKQSQLHSFNTPHLQPGLTEPTMHWKTTLEPDFDQVLSV